MQAALLETGQKGAPMDFGFAQGHADAKEGTFAIGPDPQGCQRQLFFAVSDN
jgi:hypothetical protein